MFSSLKGQAGVWGERTKGEEGGEAEVMAEEG